jgi:hypothetical protein
MGRCGEYNLHERVYSGIGGPPKAQQEARERAHAEHEQARAEHEQALSGYENKKKQQLKKILYPIIRGGFRSFSFSCPWQRQMGF